MIKDKTGKTNGKLAYGWCFDELKFVFNSVMIDSADFWISFYTNSDFKLKNIRGNEGNNIACSSSVLYWTEDGTEELSLSIPFNGSQHRITLCRYNNKITVYFDYKILGSIQLSAEMPSGIIAEDFGFKGNVYDIRLSVGNPNLGITDNYTNETSWFPCQEGYDTTIYDVLSNDNIVISAGEWVNNRMNSFYNQFYGFDLQGGVLVPNQFFGLKEKSFIYDDGQTWYSFIGDIMDKRNEVGNTFGLPEIFNDLVHLSEFYPQCIVKNNYRMWNIKELYKAVFDEYLPTGANYSFFSKRYLDNDGYPIGLSEILFYSRQVFTSESNYLYAYLLNDDRGDDKNKYPIPDENNKNNMSYAEQIMLGGDDHYLKYE